MRERMIQEEMPPIFDDIMNELAALITRIQNPIHFPGRTIDDIVADAIESDPKDSSSNYFIEGSRITIPVQYTRDLYQPSSDSNADARYEVQFLRKNKELVIPRLKIISITM